MAGGRGDVGEVDADVEMGRPDSRRLSRSVSDTTTVGFKNRSNTSSEVRCRTDAGTARLAVVNDARRCGTTGMG